MTIANSGPFARRPVRLTSEAVATATDANARAALPHRMYREASVSPNAWARNNLELIRSFLARNGAILFRNLDFKTIADFENFARTLSPNLIEYGERSSPRTRLGNGIYTSTDHPANQPIMLHNEQSYTFNWPRKIWFYCAQPAQDGGRTPLADSRKVLDRLPRRLVERFEQKQVMYVRNYNTGLGLSWREAFQTDERGAVEEYCASEGIEVEWRENEQLRTRQVRPAVRRHPQTGDAVWFNHAMFFHLSSLQASARAAMLAVVDEQDVPFNSFYGDGTAIEPPAMEAIRAAYNQETVSFAWEAGDLLLVDNMLVAHGREPFVGERKVLVAMAEPFKECAQ